MPRSNQNKTSIHSFNGVQIARTSHSPSFLTEQQAQLIDALAQYNLLDRVHFKLHIAQGHLCLHTQLGPQEMISLESLHNTLELRDLPVFKSLQTASEALDCEIILAMLASPVPFIFESCDAFLSSVRIRRFTAEAAQKTALAFKTMAAERPEAYWFYDEDHGFLLHPGKSLIEGLIAATQPEATGRLYDFSCYRATEYVMLLGIMQEAQRTNPALATALQIQNERHAIRSAMFHDVFLIEYGSMDEPLPSHYYVPGDRLWFRNPDERSADVTGFEGSWVIYLGGGLFSNFWKRDKPFTLQRKCLEIFHWRHGVFKDHAGDLQMDEARVEGLVAETLANPLACSAIVQQMMRLRDPKGVYLDGGCIDTTREHCKQVYASACTIELPHFL